MEDFQSKFIEEQKANASNIKEQLKVEMQEEQLKIDNKSEKKTPKKKMTATIQEQPTTTDNT